MQAQFAVKVAQIGIGIDQLRIEINSPAVARDGVLGFPLELLGQRQIVTRASIAGIKRDRMLKSFGGLGVILLFCGAIAFISPFLLFRAGSFTHQAVLAGVGLIHILSIVHRIPVSPLFRSF